MKTLAFVVAVLFIDSAFCGSCDNSFKAFLDCIADAVSDPKVGKDLETEFRDDFAVQCRRSFDESRSSSNKKCVLSDAELKTDICTDDGPLHGQPDAQKICKDLVDKLRGSSEDIRKCLRTEIGNAVVDELQPCIGKELGDVNFRIPQLPDFEKNSFGWLEVIIQGVFYRVMAFSRLYVCASAFPDRAKTTQALLDDRSGLYKKHCDVVKSCRSTKVVPSSCSGDFNKTKSATCKCMKVKHDEWHQKFDKVRDTIEHSTTSSECATSIKEAVGGWRYKLQNALKKCIPDKDNMLASIGIDKAIEKGCDEIQNLSPDKRVNVVNAIRVLRNLLDALNERLTRFCDVQCS